MLHRFRQRFGTAGLIVSITALILALGGTALAASGALTGKQKKEVEKIAKKFQGTGPAGPAGANGANGTKGEAGAPGKDGANGTNGAAGAPGTAGKSVTVTAATQFECEERGGALVKVEGTGSGVEVCNGEEGEKGEKGDTGEPWTAGGTLPPGATETGAWGFNGTEADSEGMLAPISFPIPLREGLEAEHVHFQNIPSKAAFEAVCPPPGSINDPDAPPGELCVYYNPFGGGPVNATFEAISVLNAFGEPGERESGSNRSGAVLYFGFSGEAGETAHGTGSWAVTGCSATPGPDECP